MIVLYFHLFVFLLAPFTPDGVPEMAWVFGIPFIIIWQVAQNDK